jgi:zinc protease
MRSLGRDQALRIRKIATSFAILMVVIAGSRLAMAQSDSTLPSVERVLDQFVQALGGRAALENVTSMTFTGALNIPQLKTTGKTTEYFKYPNHFAFVAEVPGYGMVRTVYDGKTAWNTDPKGGVSEISGPELSDIRRRADIHWNLKLKEFYPGLKVTGRETVNGKETWALEATVDAWTYRLYFDSATGLLVRFDTDTHKPGGNSSVLIGDYRDVGKVRFAFAASMTSSQGGWSRQLDEVNFNVPIDDSVFAKPSSTGNSGGTAGPR